MKSEKDQIEICLQKLKKVQSICKILSDACELNGWNAGEFVAACAFIVCSDYSQGGETLEELKDFMDVTWKMYKICREKQ